MNINSVVLSGHLTFDPELNKLQSGQEKCSFRIAVNGYGEKTNFFPVVVWGKSAQSCFQYLQKGSGVIVKGRIETRSFTGNDGTTKNVTEIIGEDVEFLSGTKKETSEKTAEPKYQQDKIPVAPAFVPGTPVDEDDLPF